MSPFLPHKGFCSNVLKVATIFAVGLFVKEYHSLVSAFLKKNWKWIAGGTALLIVAVIFILAFRVISFIGDITAPTRQSIYIKPTPDVQASVSAQALSNELFGTPTPGGTTAAVTTLPAVTPTPNFNSSTVVQKIKSGQPITVLLLGYGGFGHDGEWLTDTILVMRYDPKTKTILQFNIPRDLYVNVPTEGKNRGRFMKINSVFSYIMTMDKPADGLDARYRWTDSKNKQDGAANLVADSVEPVLGFQIDYWATLSFEGFRKFIDAMGGVEVDVERAFMDKEYPKNDNDKVDASYITIFFKAGVQKMDGETAIRYARSRKSETPMEGGDFARSRRQMRLIQAVKEKALRENLVLKSLDYMGALQGNVRFSLEFGELTALANYFNGEGKSLANDIKFSSEVLNDRFLDETSLPAEGYVLTPKEGQGKYTAIQRWVQSVISNADIRREGVYVQVLNSNGTIGIASKFTDFLLDKGFRVSQEQDGEGVRDQTEIVDYTQGGAPNTVARLKSFFPTLNVKVTQLTPDKRPKNSPNEAAIQLYLGKDFKPAGTASLTQLNTAAPKSQPVPTTRAQVVDNLAWAERREEN